jgi:hypothetical protein
MLPEAWNIFIDSQPRREYPVQQNSVLFLLNQKTLTVRDRSVENSVNLTKVKT